MKRLTKEIFSHLQRVDYNFAETLDLMLEWAKLMLQKI